MDTFPHSSLVVPSPAFAAAFRAMAEEFLAAGEPPFTNFELALRDFPAFVAELADEARGIGLPPGVVPQRTYWLIAEGADDPAVEDAVTLLGEIRLRPHLTPPFERHHGHIGYNIRPSQRGRGYATRALALVLDKARTQGLSRVMLTIEGDNPASARVIEKNGGRLEWSRIDPETGESLACYWIDL